MSQPPPPGPPSAPGAPNAPPSAPGAPVGPQSPTMMAAQTTPPPPAAPGDIFDYAANRKHVTKPTTVLDSTGHLIKGCLGAGILGIPDAYMKAGIWTGLFFTFAFGIYVAYCINILSTSAQTLYVRHRISKMSYPDLAEYSLTEGPFPNWKKYGKAFRYTLDVIICIDLFGSCCVYEIVIASTMKQLMNSDTSIRVFVLATLLPITLLCMIRSLKYLSPFSYIADFFVFVCVGATVYYGLAKEANLSDRPFFKDISGFFEYCGVVVFSMEGIGVALAIENSMKHPQKFPIVVVTGYSVVVCAVAITGFFGYWGFGEDMKTPVTLNFPNAFFPTTLKALIAFVIYVTFALNFYAPFHLIWRYIEKKYAEDTHWKWERVYRAIAVVGITLVAVAFPNMSNMMGLLGSFCLSGMGFVFPAFIETMVMWETPGLGKNRWRLWKNIGITILGIIIFISGTYTNGVALIKDVLG